VAMAREAERDGIEVVCATPHIRDDHDVRIEELPRRVEELQGELDRLGIAVRIARGAELAEPAARALSAEQLRAISLDGGGWILLEPAPGPLADGLGAVVDRLAGQGARTIIAHPERHAGADLRERLLDLVSRGSLIQWTAEFIAQADPHDPDALVLQLAREGLVHLIASDAHSSHGGRALRLSPAVDRLGEVCPPEWVDWIARRAPAEILSGGAPAPPW